MIKSRRMTAEIDGEFCVFLIGMRVNRWWKLHKWMPVALAIPRMVRKLAALRQSHDLRSVPAFVRDAGDVREESESRASAGVGGVQSQGGKQRRCRDLARDVSHRAGVVRMHRQQHAGLWTGARIEVDSGLGTSRNGAWADRALTDPAVLY